MEKIKEWASFGGVQSVYAHQSDATNTRMEFAVYTPPKSGETSIVLYFLSGLTCTWENFVTKAGAQRAAAEHGVTLVCPDTSPRGDGVADQADEYDLGQGAGFYLNATQEPWAEHYRMDDYVRKELPSLVEGVIGQPTHRAISGHSMGGHGALVLGLRNPDFYHSVSAFSPIVAPSQVPWGKKAFGAYLGADEAQWKEYDACRLIEDHGCTTPLLVDQGESDEFLTSQLRPELFEEACRAANVRLRLRRQPAYDHSYYFIASFIAEHIAWHAEQAAARQTST